MFVLFPSKMIAVAQNIIEMCSVFLVFWGSVCVCLPACLPFCVFRTALVSYIWQAVGGR